MVTHPFAPVVDENCRTLILGSMPSVVSLEEAFYYAHGRNAFWPILSEVFGTPCDTVEYEGYEGIRCQRLTDALESARADGSVELDRIADAAAAACEKGLLTDEECAKFQVQS